MRERKTDMVVVVPDWEKGSNLDDYFKQVEADS